MDESHYEHASRIEHASREHAAREASRALAGPGQDDCGDCGEPIAPARRVAFPAAVRCFFCQTAHERNRAQYHR